MYCQLEIRELNGNKTFIFLTAPKELWPKIIQKMTHHPDFSFFCRLIR